MPHWWRKSVLPVANVPPFAQQQLCSPKARWQQMSIQPKLASERLIIDHGRWRDILATKTWNNGSSRQIKKWFVKTLTNNMIKGVDYE
jgi:hypothetical protein